MTYTAKFTGRNAGADGIVYKIETEVTADDEEAARLALSERYEHIMFLELEPITAST